MRDHAPDAGRDGGRDQIAGALVADAGIAHNRLAHPARIEPRRQIGQLMDDDVGPGGKHRTRQRLGIEDIDHHRFDAERAEFLGLLRTARGSRHLMAGGQKLRDQPLPDGAGSAGKKNSMAHRHGLHIVVVSVHEQHIRALTLCASQIRIHRFRLPAKANAARKAISAISCGRPPARIGSGWTRALADLGVTQPQFATLTMLAAYPGLSNADLARLALLTPQTLSVIVANLERAGSLVRKPHAVHGRIQHIDLSDSGRALLRECRERVQASRAN